MSRRHSPRDLEQLPVTIPPWFCPSGKRGYHSQGDALVWLARLQRLRAVDAERIESRAYRCHLRGCGGPNGAFSYHLTGEPAREQVAS